MPHHTLSLWNNYQVHPRVAAGPRHSEPHGHVRGDRQHRALPGYTRVDAAGFLYADARSCALQLNVENLFDKAYFINADSNTNISPGFPRAVRVGLTATF